MPRGDGTGPIRMGAGSGRGPASCGAGIKRNICFMTGVGLGLGFRQGFRRFWNRKNNRAELEALKSQENILEEELMAIKEKISQLVQGE